MTVNLILFPSIRILINADKDRKTGIETLEELVSASKYNKIKILSKTMQINMWTEEEEYPVQETEIKVETGLEEEDWEDMMI